MKNKLSRQLLMISIVLFATITLTCVSAASPSATRYGMGLTYTSGTTAKRSVKTMSGYDQLPPDFLVFNYTQTLDHFGFKPESNMTFKQKYIINSKYWGGANTTSPIFVYTGDEAPIEGVAAYAGFIVELASRFKAFLLYIEVL